MKKPLKTIQNSENNRKKPYLYSFATLVEAWALSQYDRMSLLVGMRKASSVEDTVKCLDIRLRAEDIKCMEEAVKTIQVAVLDK